jgi:hypothetical protein
VDDEKQTQAITRRDLFAAAALNGFIARGDDNAAQVALDAIAYADTMLAALDGNGQPDGSVQP